MKLEDIRCGNRVACHEYAFMAKEPDAASAPKKMAFNELEDVDLRDEALRTMGYRKSTLEFASQNVSSLRKRMLSEGQDPRAEDLHGLALREILSRCPSLRSLSFPDIDLPPAEWPKKARVGISESTKLTRVEDFQSSLKKAVPSLKIETFEKTRKAFEDFDKTPSRYTRHHLRDGYYFDAKRGCYKPKQP